MCRHRRPGRAAVAHFQWRKRCGLGPEAHAAVRRLITDLRHHAGLLALDIETAPRPKFWRRAPVKFKKDGYPWVRQPDPDPTKPAFDPNRSYVALAQLYAGGDTAYLFRG